MSTERTNFWLGLPKPFYALAPLADVTDAPFRRLIAERSKPQGPQVFYTEFVSADGLVLAPPEGREKLHRDLIFSEGEHPIVAQFFTARPEMMERAAARAADLGFDGCHFNRGCRDQAFEGQHAGAALIRTPALAGELIAAAKQGAAGLPVSVKTRLGYGTDVLDEWLPVLLAAQPAAIALHARTRKEMSSVPARWERVARAVEIRNEARAMTLIIGNGDVHNLTDGKEKADRSGADGVMLGRAIFGTPWLFNPRAAPPVPERLHTAVAHAKLFEEILGDIKSFAIMKKHFKAYAEGFEGARELRVRLMETQSAAEVEEVIEAFLSRHGVAPAGGSAES